MNAMRLYYTSHGIVLKAARIIWRHKRHCDAMILPPVCTVLPIDKVFSENYLSESFIECVLYGVLGVVLWHGHFTKLLDAEFKYLILFSNSSKINFANRTTK